MGEATAAERVFDYVRHHFLQPDGDFLPREHAWHSEIHYQYANGWFIIGTQKQGRYDISVPAVRFLLSQQDPNHGGFYALKSLAGAKKRSDTMSTGIAGVACLAAGRLEEAEKAAGCLELMIDMQPTPTERFYTTLEADGRLGIAYPEDEDCWRVIDTQRPEQCWYAVELPYTFALLMHQATGDARYARLAQWFFDFQERCVDPWDGGSSGKAAWGCSMLYRITGEERYRDIALQVAGNYMACQTPAGWFDWGGKAAYGTEEGDDHVPDLSASDFDGTSEVVVWLGLIGSNLLARDGGICQ